MVYVGFTLDRCVFYAGFTLDCSEFYAGFLLDWNVVYAGFALYQIWIMQGLVQNYLMPIT